MGNMQASVELTRRLFSPSDGLQLHCQTAQTRVKDLLPEQVFVPQAAHRCRKHTWQILLGSSVVPRNPERFTSSSLLTAFVCFLAAVQ